MSSAPPLPELRALTGARGLAAWLVVLFHIRVAAGTTFPDWLQAALSKGYLAVDFFFMLSGFVLWLNYHERLREQGLAAAPRFLARRIARIWPLHAVVLAAAAAFALLLSMRGTPDPVQYPWAELPLHLALVHNWGFTDALTWNDPSWSISCELAAYLMLPLLILVVDWRRVPAALLLLLAAALGLLLGAVYEAIGAQSLNHAIPRMGVFRALIEFAIGTILCALWLRWRDAPRLALLGCAAGALGCIALALLGVHEAYVVPGLFAAILLALALVGDRGNPIAGRTFYWLGTISYSTYLVHYLLFVAFKLPLASAENIPLPLILLFLALTLAASIFLYRSIEQPGQRHLNRWFDHAFARLSLRPVRA